MIQRDTPLTVHKSLVAPVPQDGIYRLSFWYAARPNYAGHKVRVYLNGEEVTSVTTQSAIWRGQEVLLRLKAGSYELKLQGDDPGADKATTIDQVSLQPALLPTTGNLVANPDFETGTQMDGGWKYFQTDTTVNYGQASFGTTSAWVATGDAGLLKSGDTTWAATALGTYSLYLQRAATASQTITLPADGTYHISFRATGRPGHLGHTVQAQLDGEVIGELYTDGRDWKYFEGVFTGTAGEHTFSLVGVKNGDKDTSSAVDDIVLSRANPVVDGAARFDTLANAVKFGPDGETDLALVAEADVEQSLDLGSFNGNVTVENTTTATVLAVPTAGTGAKVALKSAATLKVQLGSPAGTPPVLDALTELPAGGEVPLEISFSGASEVGTYVLATSALANDLADRLTLSVIGGVGRLDVQDGKLVFVVQGLQYMLWRPSASTDTWSSTAWQLNGAGELTTFINGMQAVFDGNDSVNTLWVNEDVELREMTITGGSYSIAGSGKITTPAVVKDGLGSLTMVGAGFTGATAFAVNAGTLKLGDDATAGALGDEGSTVTVKAGARVDINYVTADGEHGGTAAGLARSAITQKTKFVIEGAGPDGKGALYNSYATSNWGFHFSDIALAGDATIGSVGRMDIRPGEGKLKATLTSLTNATLTVLATEPTGQMGLNLISTDVSLGRLDIPEGGSVIFEGGTSTDIPGGIHLLGGRLGFWGSSNPGNNVDVIVDRDSTTFGSGNSNVRGAFTVPENVALTHVSGNLFLSDGVFTNDGVVRLTGGIFDIRSTNYVGGATSKILLEDGDLRVFPYGVEGQVSVYQQKGTSHFNNWADWSKASLSIIMDAGTLYWGSGDSTPPVVDFEKIELSTAGGAVFFDSMASYEIPSAFKDTAFTEVRMTGVDSEVVYTMGDFEWNFEHLRLAQNDRYGYLDLEPGAALTIGKLDMGANSSAPRNSRVTIKTDASLTVTNYVRIGEWSGSTTSQFHDLVVDGGTFTAPIDVQVGYDSPFAYFTIKDGVADVAGILPRSRLSALPDYTQPTITHREVTRQTGGLLKVGANGLKDIGTNNSTPAHIENNLPNYDFQSGTLEPTAGWSTGFGANILFGARATAAGEAPYTVDTPYETTFQTGLAGAADVTLKGDGQLVSSADLQGIPTGNWTLESSADLRGASGFAGGLTLKPETTAIVGNLATNLVEFGLYNLHVRDVATNDFWNSRFPMLNTGMELLHNWRQYGQRAHHTYAYQGEFYVAPTEAGLWSFAGNFDDEIYLAIDGEEVVYGTSWEQVHRGSKTLKAGWHTFKAFGFDGTGEAGPQYRQKEWNSTTMGLGYRIGSEGSNASSDYVRFDPANLPMRPNSYLRLRRTTASVDLLTNDVWDDDFDLYVSPDRLNVHSNLRATRTCTASASGSFYVDESLAGTWSFTGGCDDMVALVIDGATVLVTTDWKNTQTAAVDLTVGWHALDIRTVDGTGDWGGMLKDVNGTTCILKVQLPGMESAEEAVAFTNPMFRFAPTADGSDVQAGLGGVSTIGEDALLSNVGVAPYLVYGTLGGSGYVEGDVRFTGAASRLAVTGRGVSSQVDVVKFRNGSSSALADLGGVTAVFEEKPTSPRFLLSESTLGLTAERAALLAVDVKDAAGNDYSEQFTVSVKGGSVTLVNSKPFGLHIIVR